MSCGATVVGVGVDVIATLNVDVEDDAVFKTD